MDTEIDEFVGVWAFFGPSSKHSGSIFPIAMNWRRRYIKFERVILSTTKQSGDTKLVDLVCASNGANYQLEYNTSNNSWKVKKVMGE